ncbi:cytochrome c biogenesis protein CcsA [Paenibacillus thermotolerans]|uniref:cytochrome c biogenesis protein CcsA n=1 Tax=Paenibacillus thermotolerans TaxID=3027807 RepID=UPI002368E183|nr:MULTISPECIES: cytochrome c biogenesis protein CcsA [unclassified Paenibacillus]
MTIFDVSNTALVVALFLYIIAFVMYVLSITGRQWGNNDPAQHTKKWGSIGFGTTLAGLALHLIYFVTRWVGIGHIPVSNLFEFITFLSMMTVVATAIFYLIYKGPLIGAFATPISFILLAYAMVFPWEAQPLIPSLNHYWLYIHVTTAASGEAFFAVAFAAGLMYLLRVVDFSSEDKQLKRQRRWVEFTLFSVLIVIGFVVAVFMFRGIGYEASFTGEQLEKDSKGTEQMVKTTVEYTLPPIASPTGMELVKMGPFLGQTQPLFETPSWFKGVNAGRKLNTVIWSVIFGIILYGILRLALRKPLGAAISPVLKDIDPDDLDEISYRAVAIGFPIFTLGALIFAMIWAHIAWNRFWAWDPKEVWALITWLFYSAYLHLRLGRGWIGRRSAWLAVLGFVVVMFTLIGVNLIIAGLHSYAGVS